jgi:hypothetical protein
MKSIKSFSQFINEDASAPTAPVAKVKNAIIIPAANASQKASQFISIIQKYLGKKEEPGNKGPMVTDFLKKTGIGTGNPWCMAFVYAIFDEFTGGLNPLVKTAAVRHHWNNIPAGVTKITRADAVKDPSKVKAGQIFYKSRGVDTGHTGIVVSVSGNTVTTVDGNSSDSVKLNRYNISDASTLGFADYIQSPEFSAALQTASSALTSGSAVSQGGGKEV